MRYNLNFAFATVVFLIVTTPACKIPKQIDKWVGRHYGRTVPSRIRDNDYITFAVNNPLSATEVSSTKQTNKRIVPALFYWEVHYEATSTLNAMLPMNRFSNSFIAAANSRRLRERLDGAKLEISLDANPADFKYREDGWLVWLILAYVSKDKIYVEPVSPEFAVKYTVKRPTGETSSGTVAVSSPNREKVLRFFQSIKGAVNEYLTLSDGNVDIMARELVDKVILDMMAAGSLQS